MYAFENVISIIILHVQRVDDQDRYDNITIDTLRFMAEITIYAQSRNLSVIIQRFNGALNTQQFLEPQTR